MIAICTPWTVVPRSWLMSLIITFMLEPAKLQMNWARASGRIDRRDCARAGVGLRQTLRPRWTPSMTVAMNASSCSP